MSLRIDGRDFPPEGSILDAVLAAGMDLPHLCKDDNLPAIGACRTCLVEADGRVVAACSAPASSVREVQTSTDRVERIRRGVLVLTAAMGDARPGLAHGLSGNEALAAFAAHGVIATGWPVRERTASDASNSFFSFAESACILCGRCVVACQQLQHISAIGLAGSGLLTRVTPGAAVTFRASVCTSCGSCVAACPTTALSPNTGGAE
jgi:formate dehydrogenase major subunit